MANTISTTTIINGSRVLLVSVNIDGDGSGEETDTVIVDFSALAPEAEKLGLKKAYANLAGFSAKLEWDATTDAFLTNFSIGESGLDFSNIGGPLIDRSGTGRTGDVLVTTLGLGAGEAGKIILEFVKK